MYIFEARRHPWVWLRFVEMELFLTSDTLWVGNALISWRLKNKFRSLNHSWDIEIEWVAEDQFRNSSKPSSKNAINHACCGSNWTAWTWVLINSSVGKRKSRGARKRPRRRPLAGAGLSCHCWRTSFELISVP